MSTLYIISVFIHVLSAIFWIGGMTFTILVLVPAFRDNALFPQKGRFFMRMGYRFSKISWIIFFLLIVTGTFQLWYKWIGQNFATLGTIKFWNSPFGSTFAWKLISFAIVLIISGVHDFWLGPRAAALIIKNPKAKQTKRFRRITSWIGRLNLLLGLIILFFAIILIRGHAF